MIDSIEVKKIVIDSVLTYANIFHPKESILLLRGKRKENVLKIEEVIIPPFSVHSHAFSSFPLHHLPLDLSIIGTCHSHPSGTLIPSINDSNHFYGQIMMITAYPYLTFKDIAIFNRAREKLSFKINMSKNEP